MANRIGLFLGSIAAAVVVTAALLTAGFGQITASTPAADPSPAAASTDPPQATPTTVTQVDTVYVRPAPSPKTVKIVKKAPAPRPTAAPRVVVVTRSGGEEDGDGGEADD